MDKLCMNWFGSEFNHKSLSSIFWIENTAILKNNDTWTIFTTIK